MKKYIILIFLILFTAGCPSQKSQKSWHKSTLIFFATVCELRIHSTASEFSQAKKKVKEIFSSVEEAFSPGKTNLGSGLVLYLLKESLEINKNTEGCFDITLGRLKELWGFSNGDYRIPPKDKINQLIKNLGMDKICLQEDNISISPEIKLDWGGIAKGYGVDLASKALIKMNLKKGHLNAGGDIFCWGKNPDGEDWKIGIQHPRENGYIGILSLSGMGAATSGDYQKYFIKKKRRYHHLFDPSTGYPARGKQSVTVIGPQVFLCDALSTAVFVSKKPEKILEKYPEYGAVIVDDEGKILILGKKYSIDLIE